MATFASKLNLEFYKINELEPTKLYQVQELDYKNGQWGESLVATVEDDEIGTVKVILPQRFTSRFSRLDCEKFNKAKETLYMVYNGEKELPNGKRMYLVNFSGSF